MRSASAAAHAREPSHFRSIVAHGFRLPGKRTRSLGCPFIRQTSSRRSRLDVSTQKTIHVGGEWREAASGATREILDPVDATTFAVVAEGGVADTDAAVAAARAAFDDGPWPHTPVAERAALLRRVADLLERDREKIGALECRDSRQDARRGTRRRRLRARRLPLLRRPRHERERRTRRRRRIRRDSQRRRARARRSLRTHHTVELPAAPSQLEDRARTRRRQHLCDQAQ